MSLPPLDQQLGKTFEHPELTAIARQPIRSGSLLPYPDAESALAGDPTRSPWYQPLDGEWQFLYRDNPAKLPEGVEHGQGDEWKPIPVPANWQFHGYGYPHYTNVTMPFAEEPPFSPAYNPTGVYRKHFQVPASWQNRRTLIHLAGVDGVLQLYLNGHFIGLNKDSRLPAEFDLSPHLLYGQDNLLTAIVIQYSDATFVEDQDHWRLGGIHRSVYLYSTSPHYLEDLFARTDYDPATGSGTLDLTAKVALGPTLTEGYTLRWQLFDDATPTATSPMDGPRTCEIITRRKILEFWPRVGARDTLTLADIQPWSAESPRRYRLVAELIDPQGQPVECNACWIGFKRVAIHDRQLLINGQPVLIKGVNRHDHSDTQGKVISEALMRLDLQVMKAHNINAIRTSHYPNDSRFLDLCDEYGFYLIDEANIESHDFYNQICHNPRYLNAIIERGTRMVIRDKNHPCIILWSLGNESGYGPHHDALAAWIRHYDPTRPIHYEGAISRQQTFADWDEGHAGTDIICPMYPEVRDLIAWAEANKDPRPVIPCEYSHAMGNSNGCLREYFEAFENCHGLQGGFIWEWLDHGILQTTPDGTPYWAYGGDFGDKPNDANFIADGLVWPDRTPHPGLLELKKLAQPISASLTGTATLTLRSKYDFIDTSHLTLHWHLEADGQILQTGQQPLPAIPPGDTDTLTLPIDTPTSAAIVALHLSFRLTQAQDLLPAEHEIAWEHLIISETPIRTLQDLPEPLPLPTISGSATSQPIHLDNSTLSAHLDPRTGQLHHLSLPGADNLLAAPLRFTWWRAPTDNDGIKLWSGQDAKPLGRWLKAGLDQTSIRLDSIQSTSHNTLLTRWTLQTPAHPEAGQLQQEIALTPGGLLLTYTLDCDTSLPDLPRIGIQFALQPGFEDIHYAGLGPIENYADRCAATWLGHHQTTPTDLYTPYIMPQECGNRTGLRHFAIARPQDKTTLAIEAIGQPLEGKALHHTDDALYQARHTTDLQPRPETWVSLDHRQRGLGTHSCGPDTLDHYRIPPAHYQWTFLLSLH